MERSNWIGRAASLLWRAAVLSLLVLTLQEAREARHAAEAARAAAVTATQAVDDLAALVDEALGADDAAVQPDQGT